MKDDILEIRIKKHEKALDLLDLIKQAKGSLSELNQSLSGYACKSFTNIRKDTETKIKRRELLIEELTKKYEGRYS